MVENIRSEDAVLKLFNQRELSAHTLKLKGSTGRKTAKAPVSWRERALQLESEDAKPSRHSSGEAGSPGPIVTQLDDKDISAFPTGRPLHDEPDYTVCKHCKKPIIKTAAVVHIKACLKASQKAKADKAKERKKLKDEKAAAAAAAAAVAAAAGKGGGAAAGVVEGPSDDVVVGEETKKKGAKKMAKKEGDGAKSKKRKADDPKLPKEPKAKKKKEKPDPKPKAPVDVEKQCGVQNSNGLLCARSLTCKSHPMGAKRSVLGRSQPYDVLLAAYQKKNQAKQQKAAINAEAPPPDEVEANAIPADPDEETELVMAAVARSFPQPIDRQILIPVRRKTQYIRMRTLLAGALKPPGRPFYPPDSGSAVGPGLFDSNASTSRAIVGGRQYQTVAAQRKASIHAPG